MVEFASPWSEKSVDSRISVTRVDFRNGEIFPMHTHEDGQFAFAKCGVISMVTGQGSWVVPAQRAVWVPCDMPHEMHMRGAVTIINAYFDRSAARRAGLPSKCDVFCISRLLTHLLDVALELDPLQSTVRHKLVEGLLLDEIGAAKPLPLAAPLPADTRLAKACRRVLERPSQDVSIDEMAGLASMSRRTFTRRFRAGTGMSFVAWIRQVCLMEALARLGDGATVTQVSADLGYSSPSAFSTVFRKTLGQSPREYLNLQSA